MKTAHEIWSYLNEKYGTVSDDDDEPMEEVHEDVEHSHNLVIIEDCSTSWSSDDDDDATTKSLDKIDGDASSDVHDDPTPCTLDGDDGSCSGYESDVSSSSPTISHCFMSQGDTKVSNANIIDLDSTEELLDRFCSMIKALEKEMSKTKKLKNKNSFLKKTCEQQKYLLYVTTCSLLTLINNNYKSSI